jgi:histone deacetylase 1/2
VHVVSSFDDIISDVDTSDSDCDPDDTEAGEQTQNTEHSPDKPSTPLSLPHTVNTVKATITPTHIIETARSRQPPRLYVPSAHFTVVNKSSPFYSLRKRTPGQKRKLLRKIFYPTEDDQVLFCDVNTNHPFYAEMKRAVEEEFTTMESRRVIVPIQRSELPDTASEVGQLLVLVKRKRTGVYKGRCVYNGRRQKIKIKADLNSPTLSFTSIFLALSIGAAYRLCFATYDIKGAFLYAKLPDHVELYTDVPFGHPLYSNKDNFALQVNRNLYGLKEAPLIWWLWLKRILLEHYLQSDYDECLFYKKTSDSYTFLLVYVDDILILGTSQEIQAAEEILKTHFEYTKSDINNTVDFLGVTIERSNDSHIAYTVHQQAYITKLLTDFPTVKPRSTPLTPKIVLQPSDNVTTDNFSFQQLLGRIMYLRLTRADILFALHSLSMCGHAPTQTARDEVRWLLGYLKQSQDYKMKFYYQLPSQLNIVAIVDAAYGSEMPSAKTVSGHFIYLGKNRIAAHSNAQHIVKTSAPAGELEEIVKTCKIVNYMDKILKTELKIYNERPIIFSDSETSLKTFARSISETNRPMATKIRYVQQLIDDRELSINKIPRDLNVADLHTKQDVQKVFEHLWKLANEPLTVKNYQGN